MELRALLCCELDSKAGDESLNSHGDWQFRVSTFKLSRWRCLIDRLRVLLGEGFELLLPFSELGLMLLRVLKLSLLESGWQQLLVQVNLTLDCTPKTRKQAYLL